MTLLDAEWRDLLAAILGSYRIAEDHLPAVNDLRAKETKALKRLVWGAVRNAGKRGPRRQRWAAVRDALGVGSTTATELCVAHDLDPDEMVGRDDSDDGSEA